MSQKFYLKVYDYVYFPSIIYTKLHFSQVRKFKKSLGITQKTKPKLMQIFNMNQNQEKYFYLFSLIHILPVHCPYFSTQFPICYLDSKKCFNKSISFLKTDWFIFLN